MDIRERLSLNGIRKRLNESIFKDVNKKLTDNNEVIIHLPEEKEYKPYPCTMGVGNGSGNLFVHGDHESIKHLQEKLLRMEKMKGEGEIIILLKKMADDIAIGGGSDFFNKNIDLDHDEMVNKWIEENL